MTLVGMGAANETIGLTSAVDRAFDLFEKLSKAKVGHPGKEGHLRAPDQRDLAEYIFFEVAARWEAFCINTFALELRKLYRVRDSDVVERMMTRVDGGVPVSGFSDPRRLIERAEVFLGKTSPWVRLPTIAGHQTIDYLDYARIIRNFIAHAGTSKSRNEFHRLLDRINMPREHRRGLSAGRLLLDYKATEGVTWFEALLGNYGAVGNYIGFELTPGAPKQFRKKRRKH